MLIDNFCILDCFDVVREQKDHVVLIDFSPFNEKFSNSLAFEWSELLASDFIATDDEADDPEFRYLASDCGIQPNSRNNYGIPQDVINMFKASSVNDDQELDEIQLENLNRLLINQLRDEIDQQQSEN